MKLLITFACLLLPLLTFAASYKDITPDELEKMVQDEACFKFVYVFTSWCPVCEASFESYKTLQNTYGKPNMVGFIAVSLDQSGEQLDSFIDKFKPDFPIYRLVYPDGKTALDSFSRLGISYRGRVPHATFRDCDGSVFADGSFQYPYYDTVLQYWRNNYLE